MVWDMRDIPVAIKPADMPAFELFGTWLHTAAMIPDPAFRVSDHGGYVVLFASNRQFIAEPVLALEYFLNFSPHVV